MHIADVTLFFAPHSGGVKRYLLAKHRHLNRIHGVRHTLIVPGPRDAEVSPGIFELRSSPTPWPGGYRIPLRFWRWRAFLKRLAPDVIEAGDPYHLAWTALGAARDLDIPAVAFAHSDLSRVLAHHVAPAAGPLTDWYLRRLYARFDLVLAPSHAIAARLSANGVANVLVQPLGVDGDTFHPSRFDPSLRAELGLAPQTRLLVFAGRMAREKQIPVLIEALAHLGDAYHLILVGGPARERASANVTILPYEQDSARLARLLASADALVHAGVHETFGLIVIEAMACGRPVVAVRSGALIELVGADVGVLAASSDPRVVANAIETLYASDWQAMGRCAREKVEKGYTWKSTFALQLERYAHLARHEPVDGYADIANAR